MKSIIHSITTVAFLLLVSCNDDEPSRIQNEIYLFNETPCEILAYDFVSQSSRVIGRIRVPNWASLITYRNTNRNIFIDIASNTFLIEARNRENLANYVLVFDYSNGSLNDSILIDDDSAFLGRFFYSSGMNSLVGKRNNTLYKQALSNQNVEEELFLQGSCGFSHQGVNNDQSLFFNYGCNVTTIFDLKTKEIEILDHYDVIDQWRGLFSIGLSKNKDFLIGFGLYQRHIPEKPNARNELYLVKRNLITGSFEELQIDTDFGLNNGFYDSTKDLYILAHDNELLIYDSNLDLVNSLDIDSSKFLIQQ
ncbi:hypothetical protein [Nonlabens ulvanivorans]|uniref:hypothetical protein n=1 Tax=Nonlabens ulvanivorans TaxID=906888 RepID=UPI003296DBD6